eukprot:gb/GEZN01025043.1/.p1 GENE.gb/GEZN01025043.1/~~gb/GEZN01025043.1/.p1  ORF type:complete len:146 (+),score=8.98 gb/GEZN01025043.1/:22-459(+)
MFVIVWLLVCVISLAESGCIPFNWNSTEPWSDYLDGLQVCFTVTVPKDWAKETCVILGRFFPENAAWCATWVGKGGAPTPCTPFRPDYPNTFSYPLAAPPGTSDFYLYTNTAKEFTSVWIAPITPTGCVIPPPESKLPQVASAVH